MGGDGPRTGVLIRVAWSPDGQQIATGGDNSQITLWDGDANPCGILTGQSINLDSTDNFQIRSRSRSRKLL